MLRTASTDGQGGSDAHAVEQAAFDPALVREELRKIVASRSFQASRRGKEFLQYVVDQKIAGKGDLLKERLIGIQVFGRKADYSTGEDPVVRVQAGDVRHRLERYYADPDCESDLVIQIPLGSYSPVFCQRANRVDKPASGAVGAQESADADRLIGKPGMLPALREADSHREHGLTTPSAEKILSFGSEVDASSALLGEHPSGSRFNDHTPAAPALDKWRPIRATRIALLLIALLMLVGYLAWPVFHTAQNPTLKAFWAPAAVSSRPVLLWLPKPMLYKPAERLFNEYEQSHPGGLVTREARQDQYLPLDPKAVIRWGDMVPVEDSGPGMGGVIAALNMSRSLTQQGIRFEIRFGPEATYAEMRDSSAVIVGAINTNWATQLTSEPHFAFDESIAAPSIYETTGKKRVWTTEFIDGHRTRDYGLITRQLSGKTGEFLVQVAGISHFGTEAASELLLQDEGLAKVLRSESISLRKRNLQIVVSTDITDGRAGPPHVVAVSSW